MRERVSVLPSMRNEYGQTLLNKKNNGNESSSGSVIAVDMLIVQLVASETIMESEVVTNMYSIHRACPFRN